MFMSPLAGALGDTEADMQILAHQVTIKLSKIEVVKGDLLCCLDTIVDPIKVLHIVFYVDESACADKYVYFIRDSYLFYFICLYNCRR